MRVQLLYFEGCPNYQELLLTLRELLATDRIEEEVELRQVDTPEEAEREGFLGSPTIRVNGADVDPCAEGRRHFGLECRLYRTDEGVARTPPESWIRAALERAA